MTYHRQGRMFLVGILAVLSWCAAYGLWIAIEQLWRLM